MNRCYPIFTVEAECQDCFKCVRGCPIKAIKVEGGHASVIPELCIACGHCVEVCPSHAKKIRNDWVRTKQLLSEGKSVYVSLAPSWVSEFQGLPESKLVAALRKLGFAGVSETALGAEIVSADLATSLRQPGTGLVISSACPVVVDFIRKYLPEFTDCISPVLSPLLAHARLMQREWGNEISVVFVGPCIAKKNEADRHPELVATALLFSSLRRAFEEAAIDPWRMEPGPEDHFLIRKAKEGALYPIEGGMNDTIRAHGGDQQTHFMALSGIHLLRQTLEGISPSDIREPVFLETLACAGGCVHGPGTAHGAPGLVERLRIIRGAELEGKPAGRAELDIAITYEKEAVVAPPVGLQQVRQALQSVGKNRPEDELNCGGCGYDTCRKFAVAMIEGKAETSMCVSYMRQMAQRKSNAILRCIPAAVVIVDRTLHLIECNRRFAEFAGDDAIQIFDAVPGMAGSDLTKLVPFVDLFRDVLRSGKDIKHDMIKLNNRLLSINLFNIDQGQVIGAILFDVTNVEFRREQIAARAREVIQKNLGTVQEIACKLGEHMAETELLLRSIADDYAD